MRCVSRAEKKNEFERRFCIFIFAGAFFSFFFAVELLIFFVSSPLRMESNRTVDEKKWGAGAIRAISEL